MADLRKALEMEESNFSNEGKTITNMTKKYTTDNALRERCKKEGKSKMKKRKIKKITSDVLKLGRETKHCRSPP